MRRLALCALLLCVVGCSEPAEEPVAVVEAADPIPSPDLSTMEGPVAQRIGGARNEVVAKPTSGAAWGTLGVSCDAHGLTACAATAYAMAVEYAPQDFRWVYLSAFTGELMGDEAASVAERYARAAELEPRLPTIQIRLGDALTRAGKLTEAQQAYRAALAIDGKLAIARRGLGQALLASGDAEAALAALEAAVALGGDQNASTCRSLAQALTRLGRIDEAQRWVERSTEVQGELPLPDPVRYRVREVNISAKRCSERADALMAQGQWRAALAQLQIVAESRPDDARTQQRITLCRQKLADN